MRKRTVTALILGGVFAAAVGCSGATQEEKYTHLRDVADKGADAHFVLVNENKPTTREVCEEHYRLFTDGIPDDTGAGASIEWQRLSKEYFTDSCVKGEPRVIRTRSTAPSSVPASADAAANKVAPADGN